VPSQWREARTKQMRFSSVASDQRLVVLLFVGVW